MTRPPMLAADMIRELTRPYPTTETVRQPTEGRDGRWRTTRRLHTVHHASLLTQLQAAITGGTGLADEDAGRGSFTSKPAAHLEAVDTLRLIDEESHELAVDLGIEEPRRTRSVVPGMNLTDRLLAISGKVGSVEHPKVTRWWTHARIATQWESRPFQPKGAPCPECWETSSLRVVLSEEIARCVECRAVWLEGGFRVLAQHVRWCTDHEVTKTRHLVIDDDTGEVRECVECVVFREDWASRQRVDDTAKASA